MRGDAFIHFVCGSRRVNIQWGVLLLIPKSLQRLPVRTKAPRWANLSLVAAVSVNSMPKYKKYQNGPIELRTKTLDLDKLPKATNTSLKLYIPNTLLKL